MRIAIIGSGGVGGYFGGRLAKAGFDVTFVARGSHLKAIQENGLRIRSIAGNILIDTVQATDKISELSRPDLIIIGTKAGQVKEIRNEIKKILQPNSIILPLQNGILAANELKEVIDESHILGGLCRIISKIEGPGIIHHFAINPIIVFGELNKIHSERVAAVKTIFDTAQIDSIISDDIEADLWKKFIGICVSGLLAITKTNYGELRSLPETRTMMINLLTEIYQLSQAMGINIENDFISKTVSAIDNFPFNSTTSLSRDIWEGKPSEIEYQNGTVVSLAEQYGVNTPVNRFVYNCILPMEYKARKNHMPRK